MAFPPHNLGFDPAALHEGCASKPLLNGGNSGERSRHEATVGLNPPHRLRGSNGIAVGSDARLWVADPGSRRAQA